MIAIFFAVIRLFSLPDLIRAPPCSFTAGVCHSEIRRSQVESSLRGQDFAVRMWSREPEIDYSEKAGTPPDPSCWSNLENTRVCSGFTPVLAVRNATR